MKTITGAQIRAARALLRWTAEDLANRTNVGVATIRRAEGHDGPTGMTDPNANAVMRALDDAGIELLAEDGNRLGVRFKT